LLERNKSINFAVWIMETNLEENIRLIFGLKIKQLRNDKKLSLQELAQKSNLSVSYLNEIEKGKKYPKSDKILALSAALGVNYDSLVSLKLSKSLAPITQLLHSDFLNEIPFETFGIDKSKVLEMISNAPAKIMAFISTLLEISRQYNLRQEHFYLASLRSFQELHENYFEDLEDKVQEFRKEFGISKDPVQMEGQLSPLLQKLFRYQIEETDFEKFEHLQGLRTITIPNKKGFRFLLNQKLSLQQKSFNYGREIGFQYMQLTERPYTASWLKVKSFDTVLNNFKASYFSGALLLPQDSMVQDLEQFFQQETWDSEAFLKLIDSYLVSPEMFLHRMSSLLPKFFGIQQLFYIRYSSDPQNPEVKNISKELHLSKSSNKFYDNTNERLYRQYLSSRVVHYLSRNQKDDIQEVTIGAIRSKYTDKGNEYFCITILSPHTQLNNNDHALTLGFVVTDSLKSKIKFLDDPGIYFKKTDMEFIEKIAPPEELHRQNKIINIEKELAELFEQNKA